MLLYSSWIDTAEVPSNMLQEQRLSNMHVFLPGCPMSSVVVKTIPSDAVDSGEIRVHPLLYEMMKHLEMRWSDDKNEDAEKSPRRKSVGVQIAPLPMESSEEAILSPFQEQRTRWEIAPISVRDLDEEGTEISLSILYIDHSLQEYREQVSESYFYALLQDCFVGRILKRGSVLLLSCKFGEIIVGVNKIQCASQPENDVGNAYRLPFRNKGWKIIVQQTEPPAFAAGHSFVNIGDGVVRPEDSGHVPGYQSLQKQLFDLACMHVSRSKAVPSGIIVAGTPGVGKSRLAASLALQCQSFPSQSSRGEKSLDSKIVCELTVRNLIMRASWEADLLGNVLEPLLKNADYCFLDGMHLLECDGEEGSSRNELNLVVNAILDAIDVYHETCCFVGFAHTITKLPDDLVKIGRLEKHFEMLPPTEYQRVTILSHILQEDVVDDESRELWAAAIASKTAGCVAQDMVRIRQDAWVSCQAKTLNTLLPPSLEMQDLLDAAKRCIPSQLQELDVLMPMSFVPSMGAKEKFAESWKLFAGYHDFKKRVFRQIVVPWNQYLTTIANLGSPAKLEIDIPSGLLFHGPAGCGKTESVKCLANSLGLPLIQVRAADVLDKWLGGSESLLRRLFSRARASAPCILFIDEIDSIAHNREDDGVDDATSARLLSTLLNEMDGISSNAHQNRVLVAACTNRLESLDAALLRPGRLQEHFELSYPTQSDVVEILSKYLKVIPEESNSTINNLASSLANQSASGADVEGACRDASLAAISRCGTSTEICSALVDFEAAVKAMSYPGVVN